MLKKNLLYKIRTSTFSPPAIIYAVLCTSILVAVSHFTDLPYLFGNWEQKAKSILHFNLTDNFYPPGAAIALLPFLWTGPTYSIGVFFYYCLSCYVYYLVCEIVKNRNYRNLALLGLPMNPYLSWLCLTSADQVIELLYLTLFALGLVQKRFKLFLLFGWLLCLTRPAYWIAFLLITLIYPHKITKVQQRLQLKRLSGLILLCTTLLGNVIVFASPNLASSSGLTFFYSHNKYHYLSLPLFDMDVFLDEQMNTKEINQKSDSFTYIEDENLRAGLISIKENPKEFVLATGQKINSYFFSIQKVPNLPGEYRISADAKTIAIGEERLTWMLVLGNIGYEIYRMIWFLVFITACSNLITSKKLLLFTKNTETYLFIPYFVGIIPALMFYVETRQKICSELIAVPIIFKFLSQSKKENKSMRKCSKKLIF